MVKKINHEDVVKMLLDDGRGIVIRDGYRYTTNSAGLNLVCPHHPHFNWTPRPLDVVRNKMSCPMCVGQAPLSNEIIDSRLVGRDIQRVSEYSGNMNHNMIFKCLIDNHTWSVKAKKVVTEGSGCPKCSNHIRWTNESVDTWLSKNAPNIERVSDIKNATSKTLFRCTADGYEWSAQFGNIRNGARCPACSNNKHWNNDLIDRWLVDNNKTFKRISDYLGKNVLIYWKCDLDGDEWSCRLSHTVSRGQECPTCTGGGGFKTTEAGFLYYGLVSTRHEEYYKIGISNRNPKIRLNETKQYTELIWSKFFESGKCARELEQQLLKQFKHLIQTEHKFSGSTECFTEDIRKYVDLDKFVCDNTQNNQGT